MKNDQKGFTIVELMIATTIFGVLMLLTSAAIVQIGRQFYKGIISARTQEATRNIVEEITRSLQFTGSMPTQGINGDVRSFCVGSKEYLYMIGKKLTDPPIDASQNETARAFVRFDSCGASTPPVIPAAGGTELLGEDMRIVRLSITPDATARAWTVDIKVAYGQNDLLDAPQQNCDTSIEGSQYCATSEYKATVFKRL